MVTHSEAIARASPAPPDGASARGAFFGLLIGMGTVALVAGLTPIHFLWYNVVGATSVFVAGLLITALYPAPEARA